MSKYCIKTSSKEAVLKVGSENTLGVFIDDPQNINSLSDVFVDFYAGCTKSTIQGKLKLLLGFGFIVSLLFYFVSTH